MPINKAMKTIVILYSQKTDFTDKKEFGGKSAVQLCSENIEVLNLPVFTICAEKIKTLCSLLGEIKSLCDKQKANSVVFSFDDLPFFDSKLAEKLIDSHTTYKSEYTFADGYPYGFAPELINAGTVGILFQLASTTQKTLGDAPVSRNSIFNLIKTDINSFDVETVLADSDWRLLRLAFHCGSKDNFMQCKALFDAGVENADSDKKSEIASKTIGCLKTVPSFYNIQISNKTSSKPIYLPDWQFDTQDFMPYSQFSDLVDRIADFSRKAVISLSAWGDPLYNSEILKMIEKILSYDGLSVFIETSGLLVDENFCAKIKDIFVSAKERTNGWQKIMIAVSLDSFTAQTYMTIHRNSSEDAFDCAVKAVGLLSKSLPGCVYPQFVRINQNEAELENFFRYWTEKSNCSEGNLIIQKYDDFAGELPPFKPADLSPVERYQCWHLRRDMIILADGNVPVCRAVMNCANGKSCKSEFFLGNVFEQSLEKIWHKSDDILTAHIEKKYNKKCGKCDEWYTYNF